MTARKEGAEGKISLYAPRSSSQHLVGDTFQLDGEQLNPKHSGSREERKGEERLKKQKKKKMRRSEGAINPPVQASDDTRPLSL